MTQLGEPVSVGEIDVDDWECPFSHDRPGSVTNDLNGNSGTLGTKMGNGSSTQLWEDSTAQVKPGKHTVTKQSASDAVPEPHEVYLAADHLGNSMWAKFSMSAHHLIPADASLPNTKLIRYIEGGKVISGDIGYDVNGRENGIWLPTHHALSQRMPILPFATRKHSYKSLSSQGNTHVASFTSVYTQAVMAHTNSQFHDDHTTATDYSNFVIKVLDKIQANLATIKNFNCDKCMQAKSNNGKLPPPYSLVFRLNAVSSRLASFLRGDPLVWRPPIYTSPHARRAAESHLRLHVRGRL